MDEDVVAAQHHPYGERGHTGHEAVSHVSEEKHHHHSHHAGARHDHGHHLLQVEDLSVSFMMYADEPWESLREYFSARQRLVTVMKDLNLSVHAGSILAVVGASGSGKTLLADAIMGIFDANSLVEGTIYFDGVRQDAGSLAALRGNGISFIPQNIASLDPLMKVGKTVQERSGSAHDKERDEERRRELFDRFGLDASVAQMYPHELSGGMARRVLLCCALMESPRLIIADEPTPGLDLDLAVKAMDDLRSFADEGNGVLLITHDIELALRVADQIAVFKDGTVVEETGVEVFENESRLEDEFTRALWRALPKNGFSC